jgi:phospholipase C
VPIQDIRKYELLCGAAVCALAINAFSPATSIAAAVPNGSNDGNTTTPIKHVIVIIGENRTFDHLFATYQPINSGETVLNLLSEEVVKADGTPGPKYSSVTQNETLNTVTYQISPT